MKRLLTLLAVGMVLLGSSYPALANAPIRDQSPAAQAVIKTFINSVTGRCLQSNAGGNVWTQSCNGSNFQRWVVQPVSGNIKSLKNVATGRCLSNLGGVISTKPCNPGNPQKWRRIPQANNTVSLQNVATGRCLSSTPVGQVITPACSASNFQKWK